MSKLVGKTLKMYNGASLIQTGIIDSIYNENTVKLNRESLTTTQWYDLRTYIHNYSYKQIVEQRVSSYWEVYTFNTPLEYILCDPLQPQIMYVSFDWNILVEGKSDSGGDWFIIPRGAWGFGDRYLGATYSNDGSGLTITGLTFTPSSGPTDNPLYGSFDGPILHNVDYTNPIHYKLYLFTQTYLGGWLVGSPPGYFRLTVTISNLRYKNCRGEEFNDGDKCFLVNKSYTCKIE